MHEIRHLPKQFSFTGIIHVALVSIQFRGIVSVRQNGACRIRNLVLFCVSGNGMEHSELTLPITMDPALSVCRILTETTLPHAHPVLLMLRSFLYRFADRNEVRKEREAWSF